MISISHSLRQWRQRIGSTVVAESRFTVLAKDGWATTAEHFGQIVGNVGGATVSGIGWGCSSLSDSDPGRYSQSVQRNYRCVAARLSAAILLRPNRVVGDIPFELPLVTALLATYVGEDLARSKRFHTARETVVSGAFRAGKRRRPAGICHKGSPHRFGSGLPRL